MGKEAWQIAGFSDEDSRLGKAVPTGRLFVPQKVELDESQEHLVWSPYDGYTRAPDTRAMFNEFIGLAAQPASTILRYAKKWGLLYLGPNGRPCSRDFNLPRTGEFREAVEAWRYFSRRAQSVLNIAASLRRDKRGSPTDWEALDGLSQRIGPQVLAELGRRGPILELCANFGPQYRVDWDLRKERQALRQEIMIWMELGRPGFAMSVHGAAWRLEVDYNGCLFAAIALQLALTLTGSHSLFVCSGCGLPYVRERKAPKPGQANYCKRCDHGGEALRQADRRRRERMADARRLHAAGRKISQIADELKTKPASVRRWLKRKK
jgi:hypothetical protein